jgi:hypothetical protein
MKISFTVLFILISAFCIFGQKRTSTNSKAKKTPPKASVNSVPKKSKPMTADEFVKACPTILQATTDKMTDESYTTTRGGSWSVTNGYSGFNVRWVKQKGIIILSLTLVESGTNRVCVPDYTKTIFLLKDGSKVERTAYSKFNCDGSVTMAFDEEGGVMGFIETIRVYTSKGFIQVDFTRADQVRFFFGT